MSVAAEFQIEYLQCLKPDGTLAGPLPPAVNDPAKLVPLFKRMLFVRTFDTKAIALQRTGKLGTYAASLGHEATHVGIGASMTPDDVFAPRYREYGAPLLRGVKPRDVLMYWGGDERGNDFEVPRNDYPWCVPISTQCLMAAGAALSFKLRDQQRVAVACCGDGGSSKTDFYAAVNSGGAYKLPLVLCVINNGWAISVPRKAVSYTHLDVYKRQLVTDQLVGHVAAEDRRRVHQRQIRAIEFAGRGFARGLAAVELRHDVQHLSLIHI